MIVRQEAQGILIEVQTIYEGEFPEMGEIQYVFTYKITIYNNTSKIIQIRSRCWNIYDALNSLKVVKGDGVVGVQPIIAPGERYNYSSICVLKSPFGMMRGYYNVLSLEDQVEFRAKIPSFKLSAPFALN